MRDEKGRFVKGKIESAIVEKRNSTRKLRGWHTESSKKNISTGQLKNKELMEKRKEIARKMGLEHGGKHTTERSKEKNRIDSKLRWSDPDYKDRVVKNSMLKNGTSKPNKKELFLSDMLSGDWKFVGNGEVLLGGKSPDFVNINGQKKIIELFGDYWHSEKKTGRGRIEEENLRKSHFAKYGYQTLIIWESELKSPEQLVTKIIDFKGGI